MKQQPTPAASEEPFEPLLDSEQAAALLKIYPQNAAEDLDIPKTRQCRGVQINKQSAGCSPNVNNAFSRYLQAGYDPSPPNVFRRVVCRG